MKWFATSKVIIKFDILPDAALAEVAATLQITGDRAAMLNALAETIHRKTYRELEPIITTIKAAADKHGVPDAVRFLD